MFWHLFLHIYMSPAAPPAALLKRVLSDDGLAKRLYVTSRATGAALFEIRDCRRYGWDEPDRRSPTCGGAGMVPPRETPDWYRKETLTDETDDDRYAAGAADRADRLRTDDAGG